LYPIQQTLDVERITRRLQAEFDIDARFAERDVIEFAGLRRGSFQRKQIGLAWRQGWAGRRRAL
jgi:hypothetical protein